MKILCTLTPSSLNSRTLVDLEKEGVNIFRVNLSNTKIDDLEAVIKTIKGVSQVPICLDSEGTHIRIGDLKGVPRHLETGSLINIYPTSNYADPIGIHFNIDSLIRDIPRGQTIRVGFDASILQVQEWTGTFLECSVITTGTISTNMSVNLEYFSNLEPITKKDKKAIEIGLKHDIKHYALSFASSKEDIILIRSLIGGNSFLISIIESTAGLRNMEDIIKNSDAILFDRRNLSREQSICKIPFWQKKITNAVKVQKKELYVVSDIPMSLIEKGAPTAPEINDIANILIDGVDGLAVESDTSDRNYLLSYVKTLKNMDQEYCAYRHGTPPDKTINDGRSDVAHQRLIPTKVESLSPSEKELKYVILKANAVDAEYFSPVASEFFESYKKTRKNQP